MKFLDMIDGNVSIMSKWICGMYNVVKVNVHYPVSVGLLFYGSVFFKKKVVFLLLHSWSKFLSMSSLQTSKSYNSQPTHHLLVKFNPLIKYLIKNIPTKF